MRIKYNGKASCFFYSEGSKIAAELYLPEQGIQNAPTILLCHGFAGVKELLLPAFAEYFAKAGFVAMTFDYRGFGESEGEAGRLVPRLQIEDIKNAISFLTQRSEVDAEKIGLWGTSFGGANVMVAASEDPRVKALSVQLTFADGERVVTEAMTAEEKAKFLSTLERMQQKKEKTGKEMMVPIAKVLTDEQSKAFYQEYANNFSALNIKIPFLTVAETMKHKPVDVLARVSSPILITGASDDGVNPIAESHALYEVANEPKELLVIDGATHYEVYHGEYFDKAVAKQVEWFKRYL
ncbi:UilS family quorum-quenching N-acyl-homoserine lactonase [Piscirickettsia litoralis]|uniref:Serine aminopeptidase S33 domain-containing protein n=1 Tax=Piscirickettsia litoralis TaxID=1891921 RepID=A0ABX3A3J0_9GAMM|nr:alpha/beta fold hydrolase [Piscirickettsia litoralis]ODN43408.1 hypothetical protein BGC07_11355 [Piscirickettsia litoralis]